MNFNRLKSPILLIFILSCIYISWIQPDKEFKQLSLKVIPDHDFYIDETEITNLNYREYLDYLKKNGRMEEYNAALPDTTVWKYGFLDNVLYVKHYFRHHAYQNFPLVGVSIEQARNYCKWRTTAVNKILRMRDSNVDSVVFRLPTEKEWREAYKGTKTCISMFPWGHSGVRKKEGKKRDLGSRMSEVIYGVEDPGNSEYSYSKKHGWYISYISLPVGSFWPNSLGLYNMVGNVSEWVQEGKLMGGNWQDGPYRGSINFEPPVEDSGFKSHYAGFRCVMEIVKISEKKRSKIKLNKHFFRNYFEVITGDGSSSTFTAKYECSNALFQYYLESTNQNNPIKDENWAKVTPYLKYQQHSTSDEFRNHPVVNVSHEDAIKFCEWLTIMYRDVMKLDSVTIKLPSEAEWEKAAMTGPNVKYPWRGEYAANFCPNLEQYRLKDTSGVWHFEYPSNAIEERRKADGFEFTSEIDAYYPLNNGMYNIASNAAEMLETQGIAKGGSWNSSELLLHHDSSKRYEEPNPELGFRVFLIVQ